VIASPTNLEWILLFLAVALSLALLLLLR